MKHERQVSYTPHALHVLLEEFLAGTVVTEWMDDYAAELMSAFFPLQSGVFVPESWGIAA
jgi:flagellar biosynthesis protein FliQ